MSALAASAKRAGTRMAAEIIFAAHAAQIIVALIGWTFPTPYYYLYVADISIALVWQYLFHDCFLTTWEFYLRRLLDPSIPSHDYLTYYAHKYFVDWVTDEFVDRISLIFLSISLLVAALRLAGYW